MKSRLSAFLSLLAVPASAAAQDLVLPAVRYPVLPRQAADAGGFAPRGWTIEARAAGDLDRDGDSDLALVLRSNDPANLVPVDFCAERLDTNPRMLVVALAAPDGGYRLTVQNHSLIPRRENPCQVDWFEAEGLEIRRGNIRLYLEHMMSAGGWDAGTTTFVLRWQDGALRLIGWDYSNVKRNSGCLNTISVNFLTGRVRTAQGNVGTDRERVRWSRLARPTPSPAIGDVGDGMQFDPDRLRENMPPCADDGR